MNRLYKIILVLVVICTFASCSNEQELKREPGTKLSEENIFKGYEDALHKVEGVEQNIQDSVNRYEKDF